jgi:DNA primase
MSLWDDVKTIPIGDVARRLGIVLSRSGAMRCPFPDHEDRNPSFSIMRKTNACYCHGCQRGGSVIDLVAHFKGWDAKDAVRWLYDNFLSRTSNGPIISEPQSKPKLGAREANLVEIEKFLPNPKMYAAFLADNPMSEEGRAYLQKRRISATTISHFKIGYITNAEVATQNLLRTVSKEAALRGGLIFSNNGQSRLVFASKSLLFPFHENENIIYLQARAIDAAARNRWMGLKGVSKPIYNADSIKPAKEIYICEGCVDVLSAYELRRTAIGLTGAGTKLPGAVLSALRGRTVYILPDNDPSGERMAENTLAALRKWGIHAVIQKLPHGKDLNEYLVHSRVRS